MLQKNGCSGRRDRKTVRRGHQDGQGAQDGQSEEQSTGRSADHGRAVATRGQGERARDRARAAQTEDPGRGGAAGFPDEKAEEL